MPLQATSGAASYDAFGGGVPVVPAYIEEVFSTWLYSSTGTSPSAIVNGIDLAGKGGLVIGKVRNYVDGMGWVDTVRGGSNYLQSDVTNEQFNTSAYSFNNNGYSLQSTNFLNFGTAGQYNFCSWTLRKQPKFFDIQTWTGTGSNRTISHSLGSVPACIIVKRTDTSADWQVYHRSLANTEYLVLNSTAAKATGATRWNSTTPTSTVFSIGTDATVNASGGTYVAYVFAHDAGGFGLTGSDNVISCGTFDANNGEVINLGYEPQWLLYKDSSSTSNWRIADTMRGWTNLSGTNAYTIQQLVPNSTAVEGANSGPVLTSTGFTWNQSGGGNKHIYIAIRRGPMRVPTSGTSVFSPEAFTGDATTRTIGGILTDSLLLRERASDSWDWSSRLTGSDNYLQTNNTLAESSATAGTRPSYTKEQLGVVYNGATKNQSGTAYIDYLFKRAPNFLMRFAIQERVLVYE